MVFTMAFTIVETSFHHGSPLWCSPWLALCMPGALSGYRPLFVFSIGHSLGLWAQLSASLSAPVGSSIPEPPYRQLNCLRLYRLSAHLFEPLSPTIDPSASLSATPIGPSASLSAHLPASRHHRPLCRPIGSLSKSYK